MQFNAEGDLLVTCGKVRLPAYVAVHLLALPVMPCLQRQGRSVHSRSSNLPSMWRLQDSNINLWWADNGVRAGSFDGHNGVVWTVDMTCERSVAAAAAAGCLTRSGHSAASTSRQPSMDSCTHPAHAGPASPPARLCVGPIARPECSGWAWPLWH